MEIVCFDTNILIWGIKEQSNPQQKEMIHRAKSFINYLDEKNIKVLVPSIVIAEFLMLIPPNMHATIINLCNRSFIIPTFDAAAACHFARIWQAKKEQAIIDELASNGKTKAEMKMDGLIVSIAVSQGVDCIYSHDEGIKAFGKDFIEVKEMPFIPTQSESFDSSKDIDWGQWPKKINE